MNGRIDEDSALGAPGVGPPQRVLEIRQVSGGPFWRFSRRVDLQLVLAVDVVLVARLDDLERPDVVVVDHTVVQPDHRVAHIGPPLRMVLVAAGIRHEDRQLGLRWRQLQKPVELGLLQRGLDNVEAVDDEHLGPARVGARRFIEQLAELQDGPVQPVVLGTGPLKLVQPPDGDDLGVEVVRGILRVHQPFGLAVSDEPICLALYRRALNSASRET